MLDPGEGPSIADLTDGVPMPVAGGDTFAASRAVLARLEAADSPTTPA
jgi:hypothetical protein